MSTLKSLITAPILQQLLAAIPDEQMKRSLVWTLVNDPLHWQAVAQAYDAGMSVPLSDHDLATLATGRADNSGSAEWATTVRSRFANAQPRERLRRLVRNRNTPDEIFHQTSGGLSSQLHETSDLGLGRTAFNAVAGWAGREPRQVSELALALVQGEPWAKLRPTLLDSIDDPLRPIVEFVVERKARLLCAVDLAAGMPWLMRGLLERHKGESAIENRAILAVEERIASMCKASVRSPRTPQQMGDVARIISVLAREGMLPSASCFAQRLTVRTKTEDPPRFAPDEHASTSFETGFPFTKVGPVKQAGTALDRETSPGSIWAYLAAEGNLTALLCAFEAGRAVDEPGSRIRLASAVQADTVDPAMLAYLVEIGADSFTPDMQQSMSQDTRAALHAARAKKLLSQPAAPALAPL